MTELLEAARNFAAEKHAAKGQLYGDSPYVVHLDAVVAVLKSFGVSDQTLLAAAYLHDVVEDCGVTTAEVEAEFGAGVGELVWAVTNEPGKNRKERAQRTYPKIASTPGATQLKLADRIANVEACQLPPVNPAKLAMYRDEFASFDEALYVRGQYEHMWRLLEVLLS